MQSLTSTGHRKARHRKSDLRRAGRRADALGVSSRLFSAISLLVLTWVIIVRFQRRFHHEKPGMTEGVGFEPTVGFPTLDFESSALNRTQPPFLEERTKRRTSNVQHPTLNATVVEIGRSALGVGR